MPAPDVPAGMPGLLADVARIAGLDAAIAIARAWGGTVRSLPRDPGPDHPLARLIGVQAARRLAAEIGAVTIEWPNARPLLNWADARAARRAGTPVAAIAARLRLTQRQVRRLTSDILPEGARQAADQAVPLARTLAALNEGAPCCPACGRRFRRHGAGRGCSRPAAGPVQLALPF